jgi:alcohol dehydrogenase class IV
VSWRYDSKRRVTLIGEQSINGIERELDKWGVKRAVIIATSRASKSESAELVRIQLGARLASEFSGVRPHSPIADIAEALRVAQNAKADCLVAVGGGSASDAAKAVAAALSGVAITELAGMHGELDSLVSLAAVPSTLSGAETTMGGMFSEEGRKRGFGAYGLGARLVVHDPRQLADVPVDILTTTGMNALAHCLEGLSCQGANPISDAHALGGVENLAAGLIRLVRGESSVEVLTMLQVGATFGGICLDTSGVGIHHALCHALGSTFGIAHGDSNSVILPIALRYNQPASYASQERAALRLGAVLSGLGVSSTTDLPAQVECLQRTIGVPRSLSELGVDQERMGDVAQEAFRELVASGRNPRIPGSPGELVALLDQAFEEEPAA